MTAVVIYSFFLLFAIPLTGFVALSVKHQRDSLRREQEHYKETWRKARKGSYKSLFSSPPTRLF